MSLLPQHKKSNEELAKLRESLGIPGQPSVSVQVPAHAPEVPSRAVPLDIASAKAEIVDPSVVLGVPESSVLASIPIPQTSLKQVRSLRRSDRNPVVPAANDQHRAPENEFPAQTVASVYSGSSSPKVVHSLRKSEQLPLSQIKPPAPDSSLPIHRHSPEEIREIRLQEAIAMQQFAGDQLSQEAHWVVVIPGYLCALAAAICCYYYQVGIWITGSLLAVGILIAGFILIKKPYSRHHAAFIGVITLFTGIFSVLYYFPQLRYGT